MNIAYLSNVTSVLLFLLSFFNTYAAPARPLNERSTEFAWVILDGDGSQTSPRRKITPKSIFISPSFATQNCNAGYTLDANGRCVKVVKLDTSAHEQFVLELLSQNFYEDYDDEESADGDVRDINDETLPTPGPFQLNIPLNIDAKQDKISIVVAPTNGHFEDSLQLEQQTKKDDQLDAPLIITKIDEHPPLTEGDRNKLEAEGNEHDNLSTSTAPRTTITNSMDNVIDVSGITQAEAKTTQEIVSTTPTAGTTTTMTLETTTLNAVQLADNEQQAIFFKIPTLLPTLESSPPANRNAIYYNHRNRDKWLFPPLLVTDLSTEKQYLTQQSDTATEVPSSPRISRRISR